MENALLGLLGVLVGALLAEVFRRLGRIDAYSEQLFLRRFDIHEELYRLMDEASEVAQEVMHDSDLTSEERKSRVSEQVLRIARFTDAHALLLNRYIGAHCVASLMGSEDVQAIEDEVERAATASGFTAAIRQAKKMILRDSGAHAINRTLGHVARSKPSSPVIEYMKEREQERI